MKVTIISHGCHMPLKLPHSYKRVIQFELNEISKPVIDHLISKNKLHYFNQINKTWSYYQTISEDNYEHYEPWIQWTTAHTGKRFSEHKIFRLSDAVNLTHPQIWEVLSQHNIESCIVGSMNAVRGSAQNGFFFPDPWTKVGTAYPNEFQPLWDLISNAVNRHATQKLKPADVLLGAKLSLKFKLPISLYWRIALQLLQKKIDPLSKWQLAGTFDLLLANMFRKLVTSKNYQFYTLFLNAAAHYQHHHWRNFSTENFNPEIKSPDCKDSHDPMTYGYQVYDKVVKLALELAKDKHTLVIIASGLSQIPFTQHEHLGGMNYYRLYDHSRFVKKLGLVGYRAIPLMSRSWQLEGKTQQDLDNAKYLLNNLCVGNEKLFEVEQNTHNSLYIETAISRKINAHEKITYLNGQEVGLFNSFFHNIAIKTGHHSGLGSLWVSLPKGDDQESIPLSDLFPLTLNAFGIQ